MVEVKRTKKLASQLRRLWSHAFDHPSVIFSFGAGWALGMMLGIPLLPWELSGGASTVFGSAAGALIGAGGAALLAVRIANRADRKARSDVERTLATLKLKVEESLWSHSHDTLSNSSALKSLDALFRTTELTRRRLALFHSSDRYVSAAGIAIVDSIDAVDDFLAVLAGDVELLGHWTSMDQDASYSISPSTQEALHKFINRATGIADTFSDH